MIETRRLKNVIFIQTKVQCIIKNTGDFRMF